MNHKRLAVILITEQMDLSDVITEATEQNIDVIGIATSDIMIDESEDGDYGGTFNSSSYYGGSPSNGSDYGGVFGDYNYGNGSSPQEEELSYVEQIALSFGADMNTRNVIAVQHTSYLKDVAVYVDELVCLPGKIGCFYKSI